MTPRNAAIASLNPQEQAAYLQVERWIAEALAMPKESATASLLDRADWVKAQAEVLREYYVGPDAVSPPRHLWGMTRTQLWNMEARLRTAAALIALDPPPWPGDTP